MKTKTMLSIEEDLKDKADEYVKTHKDASSFSGLVSLALREFLSRDEKKSEELKQEAILKLLAKQTLIRGQNLSEDMYYAVTAATQLSSDSPTEVNFWKSVIDQQQEVMNVLLPLLSVNERNDNA